MSRILITLTLLCSILSVQVNSSYGQMSQGDSSSQSVNPVLQWNRALLVIVRTPGAQPATIHPTRSFAIMHAAIYDAVNAIDRRSEEHTSALQSVSRRASPEAATAAA